MKVRVLLFWVVVLSLLLPPGWQPGAIGEAEMEKVACATGESPTTVSTPFGPPPSEALPQLQVPSDPGEPGGAAGQGEQRPDAALDAASGEDAPMLTACTVTDPWSASRP